MDSYYDRNRTNKEYFFVDSKENPIDSLESILVFLERKDNLKWKWIIFALHHALYQFCIANLEGTMSDEVLTSSQTPDKDIFFQKGLDSWKKSVILKSNNLPLYRIGWEIFPGEPQFIVDEKVRNKKLIGFWSAIARVQDGELFMSRYIDSKAIVLSENEEKSIITLTQFRNKLVHFIPTSWGVRIEIVKETMRDILNVIERLVFDTNQFGFFEKVNKDRIRMNILNLRDRI